MKIIYPIVALCSIALSGCLSHEQEQSGETPEKALSQEGRPCMLEVKNFALTEENLRLDYRVDNVFPHDIWVCEDVDIDLLGQQNAETRIVDETLWIKLRFDLESNNADLNQVFARYRRLPQGRSHSGMIPLDLPVRNRSPVYFFLDDFSRPNEPVILRQAIFEVGYFKEDLPTLFSQSRERGWLLPGLQVWHRESKDPNVVFVPAIWQGLDLEQSVQVTIADVNIPGMLGGLKF